jgi:hypothetical protein
VTYLFEQYFQNLINTLVTETLCSFKDTREAARLIGMLEYNFKNEPDTVAVNGELFYLAIEAMYKNLKSVDKIDLRAAFANALIEFPLIRDNIESLKLHEEVKQSIIDISRLKEEPTYYAQIGFMKELS